MVKCPMCAGKGWAYQYVDIPILDLLGEKVTCPRCEGTGKYISYEEKMEKLRSSASTTIREGET